MPTLVFDIETSALPVEAFDDVQLEYLFREANNLEDPEESQAKQEEIQRMFALWPFTAQAVCIAMINADSRRGQVIYLADDPEPPTDPEGRINYVPCADETEVLAGFWEATQKFDTVVTFNGRGFDVPFLYLRSAVLNVPITRKDWLGYRFATQPHCDLAEQLSFYNVSGRSGAARKFNLDFYCKAFGIESPKAHGITGMDVSSLMEEGRFQDIADYCVRDVDATVALYHIWKERLQGVK